MSYQVYVTQDFPYAFHTADSIAGARVVAPLVRGLGNASAIETGDTATFTFPGFVQSRRDQAWALEAWFLPLGGNSQILGHAEGDGIRWESNNIIFRLKLSDETIDVTFTPEQIKTFHVVAQYSRNTMTLYVNGKMVGYHMLTDVQAAKAFATFAAEGTLVSTGNHIIDAVALYTTDVAALLAAKHFDYGSKTDSMMILTASRGGAMFEHANFAPTYYYKWTGDAWDWRRFAGLGLDSEGLYATTPSTWADNYVFEGTLDVLYLDWKGYGNFTVQYALDGVTWVNATKLTPITTTAPDDIVVRIVFADSNARVQELSVVGAKEVYLNETPMERAVKVTFASASEAFYPIENPQFGGARGTAAFEASLQTTTSAVEFWVKPDASSAVSSFTGFTGTTYVNGVAGTALKGGEWNHVFINIAAPENTVRTIGGAGRWACPTFYQTTLSAAAIADLYASYYGQDVTRIVLTGFMTVSDLTHTTYAYDWTAAGTT